MAFYRVLLAVLVVMVASVFMQGKELFRDEFFLIAYAIMALALFAGTRYRKTRELVLGLGLLIFFSIGALSTWALLEMFASAQVPVFKLAVVISLDVCAILFLQEGRSMRSTRQESGEGAFWKPVG
jgi:hypothetical protein